MGKKAKRKKKRETKKYPALEKNLYSKIKQEYFDIDYVDQLNEKEKAWLNTFMDEHLNARMNHKGQKLHESKEKQRDIFHRNNARNRDLLSLAKATGTLDPEEVISYAENNENKGINETEDAIIEYIDNLKKS